MADHDAGNGFLNEHGGTTWLSTVQAAASLSTGNVYGLGLSAVEWIATSGVEAFSDQTRQFAKYAFKGVQVLGGLGIAYQLLRTVPFVGDAMRLGEVAMTGDYELTGTLDSMLVSAHTKPWLDLAVHVPLDLYALKTVYNQVKGN